MALALWHSKRQDFVCELEQLSDAEYRFKVLQEMSDKQIPLTGDELCEYITTDRNKSSACSLALTSFPVNSVCVESARIYAQLAISEENYLEPLKSIVDFTAMDFACSHNVWEIWRSFVWTKYQSTKMVEELYIERLKTAHATLEETYNGLSSFLSANDSENYESVMIEASKIVSTTKKHLVKRQQWEESVNQCIESENSLSALPILAEYIGWEKKQPSGSERQMRIASLYWRALDLAPYLPEIWQDLIIHHQLSNPRLHTLNVDGGKTPTDLYLVARAAVVYARGNGELAGHFIRISLAIGGSGNRSLVDEACMEADQWTVYITSYLNTFFYAFPKSEELLAMLKSVLTRAYSEPYYISVLSTVSNIYSKLGLEKSAYQTWAGAIGIYDSKAEFWIEWAKSDPVVGYRKAMRGFDCQALDKPDLLCAFIVETASRNMSPLEAESIICNAKSKLRKLLLVSAKKLEHMDRKGSSDGQNLKRQMEVEDDDQSEKMEMDLEKHNDPKSVKQAKTMTEFSRDRESNTIILSGVDSVDKGSIKTALERYGKVLGISDYVNGVTVVEFENGIRDVPNEIFVDGFPLTVRSGESTIVWVTNFMPGENAESLTKKFSKYGTVLSVRMPSLKFNSQRRFCYVQMSSREQAKHLVEGEDNREGLVAKISDPSSRKARSGAMEDGREIFVKGIDFDLGEEDIKHHFEKYGKVEFVRLPRKGRHHEGYAFVAFETVQTAVDSLASNGQLLGKRTVTVTISQKQTKQRENRPKHQQKPQHNLAKTIVVEGILHSTDKNMVTSTFEKYGPLVSVELFSKEGKALVEYDTVSAAGTAQMATNGTELNGQIIRVTSLEENKPNRRMRLR